jgi:hypothetical protein
MRGVLCWNGGCMPHGGEYFLSTQVVSPSLSKSFLWYVSRIERGTGQSSPLVRQPNRAERVDGGMPILGRVMARLAKDPSNSRL